MITKGLTEAPDISLHTNIVQAAIFSLNLTWILFSGVAHHPKLWVLERSVVVESDFGVEANNYSCRCDERLVDIDVEVGKALTGKWYTLILRCKTKGVDFHLHCIHIHKQLEKVLHLLRGISNSFALETKFHGHVERLLFSWA